MVSFLFETTLDCEGAIFDDELFIEEAPSEQIALNQLKARLYEDWFDLKAWRVIATGDEAIRLFKAHNEKQAKYDRIWGF